MKRILLLPKADVDVDDQSAFFAMRSGLDLALRFQDSAERTFRSIAQSPGLGEPVQFTDPRLVGLRVCRVHGFPNHLVIYRVGQTAVEIVRVAHGARDLDALLGLVDDIPG